MAGKGACPRTPSIAFCASAGVRKVTKPHSCQTRAQMQSQLLAHGSGKRQILKTRTANALHHLQFCLLVTFRQTSCCIKLRIQPMFTAPVPFAWRFRFFSEIGMTTRVIVPKGSKTAWNHVRLCARNFQERQPKSKHEEIDHVAATDCQANCKQGSFKASSSILASKFLIGAKISDWKWLGNIGNKFGLLQEWHCNSEQVIVKCLYCTLYIRFSQPSVRM